MTEPTKARTSKWRYLEHRGPITGNSALPSYFELAAPSHHLGSANSTRYQTQRACCSYCNHQRLDHVFLSGNKEPTAHADCESNARCIRSSPSHQRAADLQQTF